MALSEEGSIDVLAQGLDKRHPEDVKFWAIADDPNASDGEHSYAFNAILKRSGKRK